MQQDAGHMQGRVWRERHSGRLFRNELYISRRSSDFEILRILMKRKYKLTRYMEY